MLLEDRPAEPESAPAQPVLPDWTTGAGKAGQGSAAAHPRSPRSPSLTSPCLSGSACPGPCSARAACPGAAGHSWHGPWQGAGGPAVCPCVLLPCQVSWALCLSDIPASGTSLPSSAGMWGTLAGCEAMGWVVETAIPDHVHSSNPPGPAGRCFLRKILRTSRYSQCHTAGTLRVAELAALAPFPPRKTLRPISLPALTPAHLLCLTLGFLGMHSPQLADLPSPPSRAPALSRAVGEGRGELAALSTSHSLTCALSQQGFGAAPLMLSLLLQELCSLPGRLPGQLCPARLLPPWSVPAQGLFW